MSELQISRRKLLKASAAGISAALIFGYMASLVFEPKMKK